MTTTPSEPIVFRAGDVLDYGGLVGRFELRVPTTKQRWYAIGFLWDDRKWTPLEERTDIDPRELMESGWSLIARGPEVKHD